jgi:hypothetical protein
MTDIHVHVADPTGSKVVPPVIIHIDLPRPRDEGDDWADEARARHRADAVAIADTLWAGLPGGTLDDLVAEMMTRRASLFRVPMLAPRTNGEGGAR